MSEIEFAEEAFIPSSLTPLEDEPLDPEEQFRQAEDDITRRPEQADVVITQPPPIGRGWAFDPNLPGFVLSPQQRGPLPTRGLGTLKTWILKALNTERGAFPIYSYDFGMTRPFDLIGQPGSETAIADYEDRARNALLKHPRITSVRNFKADFELDRDFAVISFEVLTDQQEQLIFEERVRI